MIAPREIGRVEFYWFVVFRCIVVADVVVVIGFVFVAVLVVGVVKHFLGLLMFWFFLGCGWCFSCVGFATVVAVVFLSSAIDVDVAVSLFCG
jgi:hypothetical protein